MVEPEEIIEIGEFYVDVSNITVKKKRIAVRKWNRLFNIKTDKDGEALLDEKFNPIPRVKNYSISDTKLKRGILTIGLYLVRQDREILERRFTPEETEQEIKTRRKITVKYIETLTIAEMESFIEWVYEKLVGTKKKVVDLIEPIITQLENLTDQMTDKEMSDLIAFCTTSFSEQVGLYQKSKVTQKEN
ncbi:MAG: hypothetical protein GY775_10220 [Candidatus Scalindua sp.]|nr:hypothetical protein [Candidatus Scalindua sp.]